ncbi:MAG: hypothetical protein JSS41_06265 [Proteobacteria bacterium]|nr:hypothetical protein [Pseudomonadota bacterium]
MPQPLVADGGVPFRPPPGDPIQAWLELMEVVEALCPVWPVATPAAEGGYRL